MLARKSSKKAAKKAAKVAPKSAKKAAPKKAAKKPIAKIAKKAIPLKPRHQAFAEAIVANGGNATDAARKAGVKGTDGAIQVTAHRMLRNAKVQEHIQQRTREKLKGIKADADEVLFLLADHLRGDIADLSDCIDQDGRLDLKKAKQMGVSNLIKKAETRTTPTGEIISKIEIHDSQAAAGRLADIMGLKQQPRVNEDDVKRVNAELARLISEGWEPEDARSLIIEAEPGAVRWLKIVGKAA